MGRKQNTRGGQRARSGAQSSGASKTRSASRPGASPQQGGREPSTFGEQASPRWRFERRWALPLLGLFLLALVPRYIGAVGFGLGLDEPGTIRIVNYDEAGSCRAALGHFNYTKFVGYQVIGIATLLGHPPSEEVGEDRKAAKNYCQSQTLLLVNRLYAAVCGALTVVLVGLLGLMLRPDRPSVAWTAAALLALSNLHVAQSHWGTVDTPQLFFVTGLTAWLSYALVSGRRWLLWASPLLLVAAIWVKAYVFAVAAYLPFVWALRGQRARLVKAGVVAAVVVAVVVALGWSEIFDFVSHRSYLLWGRQESEFGTGYAHIGLWRRWIRNAVNIPVVHLVGLGVPACFFVWAGLREAIGDRARRDLWLLHAPTVVYGLYMLLLAPVTYYRHYLPLFPTVVLLAAVGFLRSGVVRRRLAVGLFVLYPLLLTVDSERGYLADPRYRHREWLQEANYPPSMVSFYVAPPMQGFRGIFDPDRYREHGAAYLRNIEYVVLSENWYDTAFANELNGPIAWRPEWLIKTTPERVIAYRRILAGEDPNLELVAEFNLSHFTPEFLLHRRLYGSFQLFVGDLKVFRVVR